MYNNLIICDYEKNYDDIGNDDHYSDFYLRQEQYEKLYINLAHAYNNYRCSEASTEGSNNKKEMRREACGFQPLQLQKMQQKECEMQLQDLQEE